MNGHVIPVTTARRQACRLETHAVSDTTGITPPAYRSATVRPGDAKCSVALSTSFGASSRASARNRGA
jgi:hypothetical protein